MSLPAPSARSRVRRLPDRGRYDRDTIAAILDEGLVAHVAAAGAGEAVVVPMAYGREGDRLYLHGSPASRTLRALAQGAPACATVTLLDGLVLARSAFHSSMNYRSVVVLGRAERLEGDAKLAGLRAVTEHLAPGRWDELRPPTAKELGATAVVAMDLREAAAKVRTGPPHDEPRDLAHPVWAGVVPLRGAVGAPQADSAVPPGTAPSPSVTGWSRPGWERLG